MKLLPLFVFVLESFRSKPEESCHVQTSISKHVRSTIGPAGTYISVFQPASEPLNGYPATDETDGPSE